MAQQAQVKNYWTFVKGFVTETGPLTFPENTALSLDNVVLDVDGSITPRKGFVDLSTAYVTSSTDDVYERGVTTFQWESAGGAEAANLFVLRAGHVLRFFTADTATPGLLSGQDVDLSAYIPGSSTYTSADLQAGSCSLASGDGRLFVVTPYTNPIIIDYDVGTATVSVTELTIKERDLEGVDDGTSPDFSPPTLTAEHKYNLLNSGWNNSKINSYRSHFGRYPSRSEDPWTGVVEKVFPASGDVILIFDPRQYSALGDVGFGTSEAARGHYVLQTFDTSVIVTADVVTSNTSVTVEEVSAGNYEITVSTATNVINNGDVAVISGSNIDISGTSSGSTDTDWLDGSYTVTGTAASQFTFTSTDAKFADVVSSGAFTSSAGDDEGETTVPGTASTVGTQEDKRFEAVAFYAGRAFYAGCQPDDRQELAGRVYYSQIIRNKSNASRCYQSNDPSAKNLNDLVDTDGGYITINNLGVVHAMVPFRQSLILITTNGCWEIGAGDNYFTPASYIVRQISDRGSRFKKGVFQLDGRPAYWSEQGLELVSESEITGAPEVQSLTDQTIKTFVQQSIVENSVSAVYDKIDNVAYWVFQPTGETYTRVLCFDIRLGAFYTWTVDNNGYYIRSIDHFDNNTDERLRLLIQSKPSASLWQLDFHKQDYEGNKDFLNSNSEVQFVAHIEAGYELLGDGMRSKQAVKVATYCERDENASLFARGKYEWSTGGVSGKWNNAQQAYRDAGNGHGLSISRLRMRGSGPAFRIRYESDGDKDFKLYGWSVLYVGGNMV